MVTMDEDGIPQVLPHDPLADHAAALADLASETCWNRDSELRLRDILTASVQYARELLAARHGSTDGALGEAINAAERRITNIIGGASEDGAYKTQ